MAQTLGEAKHARAALRSRKRMIPITSWRQGISEHEMEVFLRIACSTLSRWLAHGRSVKAHLTTNELQRAGGLDAGQRAV